MTHVDEQGLVRVQGVGKAGALLLLSALQLRKHLEITASWSHPR